MALPDKFVVRFRGGPIGGTEHEMRREDFHGGRYDVPVLTYRNQIVQCPRTDSLPTPQAMYRAETYELERTSYTWRGSLVLYDARWIDPNEFLHQELEKVRKELRELQKETENMQTLVAALKILKESL